MNIRRPDPILFFDTPSSQGLSPISSNGKKKSPPSPCDSIDSIAKIDRESLDSSTCPAWAAESPTPLSEDSITSLDSIVPRTLDFEERDNLEVTPEKQLANLRKKYSITKGLLDDSLAEHPTIKSSLTLENFSYDNIRKLLLYPSHRENSAEKLQDRKVLKEESLSFIRALKKKLNALETEIENLEPEDWGDSWHEVSEEEAQQRYGTKVSEK